MLGNKLESFTVVKNLDNTYNYTKTDVINPEITIPSDKTFEATAILTPLNSAHIGNANATDDTDPNPTITHNSTGFFPLGTTVIEYFATDKTGNNSTSAFQSIIIEDTTKPVLTVPANYTIRVSDNSLLPISLNSSDYGIVNATDIFPVSIQNNAPSNFEAGETVISYNATDSSGNISFGTQTITVLENLFGISQTDLTVTSGQTIEISGNNEYRNLTIENGGILIC